MPPINTIFKRLGVQPPQKMLKSQIKQLTVVGQDDYPGRPERPEQYESNKKKRTMTQVNLMPTERQKTCPHPVEFVVILSDDITICNHCYGLLDENFQLIEEKPAPEIVEAA
jgi:hypothetical protein